MRDTERDREKTDRSLFKLEPTSVRALIFLLLFFFRNVINFISPFAVVGDTGKPRRLGDTRPDAGILVFVNGFARGPLSQQASERTTGDDGPDRRAPPARGNTTHE